MNAVILCGGLGSRLGSLTKDTPKPLLEVAGRPFIAHVLDRLQSNGVTHACLAVSFQWHKLCVALGDNWNGLPLSYSVEDLPLGTGGAIRQALTTMGWSEALIANGDTLVEIDLEQMQAFAHHVHADVVLGLKYVQDTARYGRVNLLTTGEVSSFSEKGLAGPGLINAGLFWIRADFLTLITEAVFSFEQFIMMSNLSAHSIYGLRTDGYFIDMGIPIDLEQVRKDLAKRS
jgi:D-glycero-alpha-D-manno-heptose 1-phosphate guanylyltransferase